MKVKIFIGLLLFATCLTVSAQSLSQTNTQINKELVQKADYALDQAAYMQSEDHREMLVREQMLKEQKLKADTISIQDGVITPNQVGLCPAYYYTCQSGYTWSSSHDYGTICPFCGNPFADIRMELGPCIIYP